MSVFFINLQYVVKLEIIEVIVDSCTLYLVKLPNMTFFPFYAFFFQSDSFQVNPLP
jgi:hypothetical protein